MKYVLASFIALVMVFGTVGAQAHADTQSPPVQLDTQLFLSSVPSHMIVGQNYSVRVLIRNDLNLSIPALVQLSVPYDLFIVLPLAYDVSLPPQRSYLAVFTVIPRATFSGMANVSAFVYGVGQTNTSETLRELTRATTFVNAVGLSPEPVVFLAVMAVVVLASVGLAIGRSRRPSRHSSHWTPTPDSTTIRSLEPSLLKRSPGEGS